MSVWDLQCGESTRHTLCFFSHLRALTLPNLMQKRGHEEEHSRLFCADVLMVTVACFSVITTQEFLVQIFRLCVSNCCPGHQDSPQSIKKMSI